MSLHISYVCHGMRGDSGGGAARDADAGGWMRTAARRGAEAGCRMRAAARRGCAEPGGRREPAEERANARSVRQTVAMVAPETSSSPRKRTSSARFYWTLGLTVAGLIAVALLGSTLLYAIGSSGVNPHPYEQPLPPETSAPATSTSVGSPFAPGAPGTREAPWGAGDAFEVNGHTVTVLDVRVDADGSGTTLTYSVSAAGAHLTTLFYPSLTAFDGAWPPGETAFCAPQPDPTTGARPADGAPATVECSVDGNAANDWVLKFSDSSDRSQARTELGWVSAARAPIGP